MLGILVRSCCVSFGLCIAGVATGQSTARVHTASPQVDPGVYSGRLEVDYPTPYVPATEAQIRAVLDRVLAYVDTAAPVSPSMGRPGAAVST